MPQSTSTAAIKPAKRGRPRMLDRVAELEIAIRSGRRVTTKTAQNRAYAQHAVDVLGFKRQWAWLGLGKHTDNRRQVRQTVLSELGRLRIPGYIRDAAAAVCKSKPATDRLAIRFVRSWRSEHPIPPELMPLTNAVRKLCTDFKAACPGLSWESVWRAVAAVLNELPNDER